MADDGAAETPLEAAMAPRLIHTETTHETPPSTELIHPHYLSESPHDSSTCTFPSNTKTCIYLAHDERMMQHAPLDWTVPEQQWPSCRAELPPEGYVFENPERLRRVYDRLVEVDRRLCCAADAEHSSTTTNTNRCCDQQSRFRKLSFLPASRDTIALAHTLSHHDQLQDTSHQSCEALMQKSDQDEDLYYCPDTFLAATLACGGVVACVQAVTLSSSTNNSTTTRALALVRPPGHHACQETSMGFCFVNSVAVAAKHALATNRARRICILDWDIHHGNGVQELTHDDANILYMSLHRYNDGTSGARHYYFPGTGSPTEVGVDGSNINVAWTKGGMGNAEYAAAFSELLLPVLVEWKPDLVIVSCGFDAARGDLIGDCDLTPDMYHAMTRSVMEAAGVDTPLVVALEGGYNLEVISQCMEAVALALLDEEFHDAPADQSADAASARSPEVLLLDSSAEIPYSSCRLASARRELARYCSYTETAEGRCANIHRTATENINETISCLLQCPHWADSSVRLTQLVPVAAPLKPILSPRRTRSTTVRKQQEQQKDKSAVAELSSALNQLALA